MPCIAYKSFKRSLPPSHTQNRPTARFGGIPSNGSNAFAKSTTRGFGALGCPGEETRVRGMPQSDPAQDEVCLPEVCVAYEQPAFLRSVAADGRRARENVCFLATLGTSISFQTTPQTDDRTGDRQCICSGILSVEEESAPSRKSTDHGRLPRRDERGRTVNFPR
ncbi:hypothetical protein Bbelb_047330 [Branchiostoma belcheri]|nr:hypothetical protein Bbelb_047330 [Branchiostoma belcheri]